MSLIPCPKCGNQIEFSSDKCPYCGTQFISSGSFLGKNPPKKLFNDGLFQFGLGCTLSTILIIILIMLFVAMCG